MGPAKLEKANQLKIEIIDEYQFHKMINGWELNHYNDIFFTNVFGFVVKIKINSA
jgi:predicted ATP-dependent Lon-type protease